MEATEVTAQFDAQGKITPLRFTWQGQVYPVESTGRRWEEADGYHVLVMAPDGRIYELLFSPANGRWAIRQTGHAPRMA